MTESIGNKSFEAINQKYLGIPQEYKELFGFEEFDKLFQKLPNEQKKRISQVFQSQVTNTDFLRYVENNFFELEAIDISEIQFLEEKYDSKKESIIKEVQRKNNRNAAEEKENAAEEKENAEEIKKLSNQIFKNPLYENILWEFNDENPEKSYKIIEKKYKQLQEAAYKQDKKEWNLDEQGKPKPGSHSEQLNTRLERLSGLGSLPNYEKAVFEYVRKPDNSRTLNDEKRAKLAIDTSTYERTKIDGDTIQYGDQVIDFGEKPPVKYIQSENGDWNFKSTELDFKRDVKLSHEKDILTTELSDINHKLEPSKKQLIQLETQLQKLPNLDLRSPKAREQLAEHFAATMPRTGIVEMIESMENLEWWVLEGRIVELKNKIGKHLEARANGIQQNTQKLSTRKVEIEKRMTQIDIKVASQEALFQQKVEMADEKARKRMKIVNALWVDQIPRSAIKQIFSMVNESNPIKIEGNTITGINLETLDFEWTFNPPLWNEGINWLNSQRLFAKVINKMITGNLNWPIENASSGNFVFKIGWEIVDKARYQVYLQNQLDLGFETRFKTNIFTPLEKKKKEA